MSANKQSGDIGEVEVTNLVSCPNCGKKLMTLPKNYPLYDVQCEGCSFRAQVKTNQSEPKDTIFGAGWDIMEKVLKSGFMVPPLFVNFKWTKKGQINQEIRFYPFVPKNNLRKYQLSERAHRANYKMFNYTGMSKLPYFVVFTSDNSTIRKRWDNQVKDALGQHGYKTARELHDSIIE